MYRYVYVELLFNWSYENSNMSEQTIEWWNCQ